MDYRKLLFYQKAQEVVKGINLETKSWPKSMTSQEIARQLFRAATSIGANIAEGHGRHEGQEYIHYLIIAQGSANEVDHWIHTALEREIGNPRTLQHLASLNNETRKMLTSTINTLRNRQSAKILREGSPFSLQQPQDIGDLVFDSPNPSSPSPYSFEDSDS